jgi:hypothetical protein
MSNSLTIYDVSTHLRAWYLTPFRSRELTRRKTRQRRFENIFSQLRYVTLIHKHVSDAVSPARHHKSTLSLVKMRSLVSRNLE